MGRPGGRRRPAVTFSAGFDAAPAGPSRSDGTFGPVAAPARPLAWLLCDHCGCRAFPAIAALSDEHLQIHEVAGQLRRAIRQKDHHHARRLLAELTGLLAPHVAREEQGLFAALHAEETIRAAVAQLCTEHRRLAVALRQPDPTEPDWAPVLAGLDQLSDHIDKEEYGIFPAAVILLPIPVWDRITGEPRPLLTR